jgi:hypothetical protein
VTARFIVLVAITLSITIIGAGIIQYASAFVNIISPSKGEAVPTGSSLTVSGTSDDSTQTNCNIQIIVNNNRPYQDTIPVGPGDYSKWTFVVNPQYAEIEVGLNKITSKALCDAPHEPFLVLDPLTRQYVKHYSVNVTGVPSEAGLDSEEPFVFPAPGEPEDLGEGGGGDGTEEDEEEGDEEDSLFG